MIVICHLAKEITGALFFLSAWKNFYHSSFASMRHGTLSFRGGSVG